MTVPTCPECASAAGFEPIGPYRARCKSCGALVKNEEIVEGSGGTR